MELIMPMLMQFLGQSPVFFAYLACLAFGIIFWRRYPRPCLFVCLAGLLLLANALASTLWQILMLNNARNFGTIFRYTTLFSIVGIAGNIIHAAGIGLLLAAVFQGRHSARPSGGQEHVA